MIQKSEEARLISAGLRLSPLFENQVDFETFSKSDFKRHPRLLRAGRADREDPDCNHESAAALHDGHRVLRHVALCRQRAQRGGRASSSHGGQPHPGGGEAVLNNRE